MSDPVDHPAHYNAHPSGIECIDALEDLRKAEWYLRREISRREGQEGTQP